MSLYAATYNLIRSSAAEAGDDKILFTTLPEATQLTDDDAAVVPIEVGGLQSDLDSSAESLILNKATWGSAYINLTSTVIGAGRSLIELLSSMQSATGFEIADAWLLYTFSD